MILLKKAARGIWRGKRAYIACIILMAIGIAVYVAFNLLFVNLTAARDTMYRDYRFADVFAKVRAMPLSEATALARIPGVREVSAVITADARVKNISSGKIITLRIASWDEQETEPLNGFLVAEGSAPGDNELLVGQAFYDAHGLSVGDTLTLVVGGRQIQPAVSGAAMSPEYVYTFPEGGGLMPDPEAFGFAYMPYSELAALSGKTGGADTISFLLEENVRFEDIRPLLEDALSPYGLRSLLPRKDQPSNAMLSQEISSLGAMATSLPMSFIAMAVIILYIMLKRVIEQERLQIGILKAFGFTNGEVLRHYLCYGLFIGGIGGILGIAGGLAMADMFTEMYLLFFHLPNLQVPPDPLYIAIGLAIALGSGAFGSWMGARSILKLRPSEAMRPASPPPVTSDFTSKVRALRAVLTSHGFMALRNITRNKFRSAFVVCGIAFSFSIMSFMGSYNQMMDLMMLQQFTKVQLYDLRISFQMPRPYSSALEEAFALEGVERAEGLLEIPVELRNAHIREGISLVAMEETSTLYRIYDSAGNFWVKPPQSGVVLSDSLANKLGVRRGDLLHMITPYTGDTELPLPVVDIFQSSLGMAAYTSLGSLCTLLDTPRSVNSVLLAAQDTAYVKQELEDATNVEALTDSTETLKIYNDMMESYSLMLYIMQLAGIGIAFAIIANTASISLSERQREYATLRVLGMQPREIGGILSLEYWILTIIGIIPGIPLTRLIKMAMASSMSNDMFSMPLSTPLEAYFSAAVYCAVAVLISNYTSVRSIRKFDMVEVLKERE